MPGRITPIITGEIYHVFNRGNNRQSTFTDKRNYRRAIECISFYHFAKPPMRLSKFLRLEQVKQQEVLIALKKSERIAQIFCYCLMPNHFHFLLKQMKEGGIAKFLSNFQNSYTRYFNTRHKRDGSLFLDQFKAVRIETDEQFIHVSRYIHLNPYTGYVVKSFKDLEKYPWSSFGDYLNSEINSFIDKDQILGFFRKPSKYKKFVFDQADYQRKLKEVEHLILE